MQTQIVKPATSRFEGAYLLLTSAVILLVCGGLILQRHTRLEAVVLQPYQLSAFADLSKTEQGIFNDLYAAALELQTVRRDSRTWLSLEDVVDLALPPFEQTSLSRSRGGHQWSALPFEAKGQSAMAYFGRSARIDEARSFLLVMIYRPPADLPPGAAVDPAAGLGFSIWVNPTPAVAAPKAVDAISLADLGWREAVALKGEEVQRGVTTQGKTP
jgi:hypothetical protein